jgi:hypothetical protein
MRGIGVIAALALLGGCATGVGRATCGQIEDEVDGGIAAATDASPMPPARDAGRRPDAARPRDGGQVVPVDAWMMVDSGVIDDEDAGVGEVDAGADDDDAGALADAGRRDGGARDASTARDSGFECEEFTADNVAHVAAGRAYVCTFTNACAFGTGTDLGEWSVEVTTTLRREALYRYELGPCP